MSLSVGNVDGVEVASDLTLFEVGGMLANTVSLFDKATVIEHKIGMDVLYTLVAVGEPIRKIAESIRLSEEELKLILTRTTDYRNRYMKAKLFSASEGSVDALHAYSNMYNMDKECAAAAKHHRDMVKLFLDVSDKSSDLGSNIVVNNTITVGDKSATPPMPDALSELHYGDIIDVNLES